MTGGAPRVRPDASPDESGDARLDVFHRIHPRRTADEALVVLLDAIRGGLYSPGDHLPTQVELAHRLGVSRGVVREAIEVLRRAGIVSVKRGRGGTIVDSLEHLDDLLVHVRGETRETLRAALESRRVLELSAAPLAAIRAVGSSWSRLEELVERLAAEADEPRRFTRIDAAFHVAIAELSGNPLLKRFLQATFDEILVTAERLPVGRIDAEEATSMQRSLLEALRSRDPERVRATVDDHLAPLERALVGERLTLPADCGER
jgi:GntR family transcriptional repressor for pyruvate dehydrogenase complex